MKPELTTFHNFSFSLKNSLYFTEKKTLVCFPIQSPNNNEKDSLHISEKNLMFWMNADQV